jgi:tRNA pseudouridine38-40 synthase
MARYFMHLAYNGSPFHGWQTQPNAVSVQSTIEQALATILRQPVPITGAGRTDAGVNAHMMIAHLDLPDDVAVTDKLLLSLNRLVGKEIAIYSIKPVHGEAHARFDATERTYHYFAHTRKDPFGGALSWQAPANLDFAKMNEAAKRLLGRRDFTSFSKLHTDVKTNICDLRCAEWQQVDDYNYRFVITADRFLRNMVRAVVGTLVDVGSGKITADDVSRILEQKDRCAAGVSMPGEALFLWDIKYDYYTV